MVTLVFLNMNKGMLYSMGFKNFVFLFMLVSGMGTKLEYSFDLLETERNRNRFSGYRVKDWEYKKERGVSECSMAMTELGKFHGASTKMLGKKDVESIRKTMLIQEDVFKNQVKELHRLYSVQRKLTDEIRKEIKQTKRSSLILTSPTPNHLQQQFIINNPDHSTTLTNTGFKFHLQRLRTDPCSSTCSGDYTRISKGFDLQRPADQEDNSLTGVSAIDHEDGDSEVELTLSIGGSFDKKRSNLKKKKEVKEINNSNVLFKSEREEFSNLNTSISSSSTMSEQVTKRPHWLFNVFKLT